MSLMKSFYNTFFIAIAGFAVASCVPTATEKTASCAANQAFNSVTRTCYSVLETRKVPVATASSQTMTEETPKTITLSYTDANSDQAILCEVSGVSTNVQAVSPLVTSGGLTAQANTVYSAASNLATAISTGPATAASLAAFNALDALRKSFYYSNLTNHLGVFKLQVTALLTIGAGYPFNPTVVYYYNLTQTELAKLNPMITMVNNNCQCSAGVCTTTIVPKLNKYGTAGFTYTVTDADGVSAPRNVGLTISAMSTATSHLKPVVQSSYAGVFAESSTSTPSSYYNVSLAGAADISGTAAATMRYYYTGGTKNGSNQGVQTSGKGIVTDCMDLAGSTGLNDTSCTFTPTNGNAFDPALPLPAAASVLIGTDLTFTARSEGVYGNSITVQYFSLQDDNTSVDSYVTYAEKFGLTNSDEAFIRVVGNAIKIFINPGYTSSDDIQTMVNAHPQASRMVIAAGATPFPYAFPVPSTVTPAAVSLAGGVNGFDSITYYANNLLTNSSNTGTAILRITAANDIPMVPKTYNALFSQTETFLEEEVKTVTLGFTDVDDAAGFTVSAKIDTTIPVCATGTEVSITTYVSSLITSTNFGIAGPGAFTCLAGVCSFPIDITANLNFAGNACLYYTITDPSAAVSYVQGVNVVVTNINDTPQISLAALPVITALGATATNEDLAPALASFTNIYAGQGGGVWEASQLLTLTAVSSNTALVPSTACTNYTPAAVTPVGAVIPSAVGVKRFDTVAMRCYISTGTATANDWALYPSLTVFPSCAYDYYGQGTPVGVVTPSAANKRYLDTTNNKCYKSSSTTAASWAQEASVSNYKVSYVPVADKSGTTNITVTVTDNGGTANAAVNNINDVLALTVNFIDDEPVYLSTITAIHTNEGGSVQSGAFTVDEDAGSTTDEDAQGISVTSITTDNAGVLPTSAIALFYDLNDNGVEDTGESRAVGAMLESIITNDAKLHSFYLKLDPVDGVSGNANIQMTISDGTSPKVTNFSFIVHAVSAQHGGWNNISSVGVKMDKNNIPVSLSDIQCNYNKIADTKKCTAGTAACTGTTSPNSTIVPDAVNVIYWDSAANRCYRSTGTTAFSWVDMNTTCPITRTTLASTTHACSDLNCIMASNPTGATTPAFVGQYMLNTNGTDANSSDDKCYLSTGAGTANWIEFVPAKVTLAWKPFTMVGTGADSGVQIAGWNVYRREVNADYDFRGGHLKNSTSTTTFTIPDPTVRTYTDTTAVAGKVYYYVVRPVDTIRNFPTNTTDTFSEVRVIASPANYSFVHRWIVNQEICNGMNITTSTAPYKVDQTQNFRCEYSGPGESLTAPGYYDYGRDLLVDTQESGCAYASAPTCTANGCIGIGSPTTLGYTAAANDMYYDRSTGACYTYSGAAWGIFQTGTLNTTIADKTSTALNAPLTNINKNRASVVCAARTSPTLSYKAAGVVTTFVPAASPSLPTKKDYISYASQKLNITDPEVTELEQGFSLNIQSRCNGSSASGIDTAYTDSPIPSTSFIYSLPGTAASGIRSLYTGSIPWGSSKGTEACVSRFGIQDLYGNVAEWVDDGVSCDSNPSSTKVCSANIGGSFTATDFGTVPYAFDNQIGPFAEGGDGFAGGTALTLAATAADVSITVASTVNFPTSGILHIGTEAISYASTTPTTFTGLGRGVGSTTAAAHAVADPVKLRINDDSYLTEWTFADELFGAGNFNYPLGLPLTDNIDQTAFSAYTDWILAIGPSNGITTNKLHEDGIIVNASAGANKSFAVGGSYLSGNRAGRFSSELINNGVTSRPDVGFRCIVPINTAEALGGGDYPDDNFYNYPN